MDQQVEDKIIQYYHSPTAAELESSLFVTWAGYRKCSQDHNIGPRVIDNYKMVFVLSGEGYLQHNDNNREHISTGDMFTLFPRIRHHYYANPEDPWEIMWVSFNGKSCPTILNQIGVTPERHIIVNALTHPIHITMEKILKTMGDEDEPMQLRAIGCVYLLFSRINELTRTKTEFVDRFANEDAVLKAITFIEQNYYIHIDVNILCHYVNYSRSYLSRQFKKETNLSIPEYINNVRIQNAKQLLRETNLPVQEVAASVGIIDSFYFSKTFKKLTGCSPLSYRKNMDIPNIK